VVCGLGSAGTSALTAASSAMSSPGLSACISLLSVLAFTPADSALWRSGAVGAASSSSVDKSALSELVSWSACAAQSGALVEKSMRIAASGLQ
jgi:hypothetical protein